MHGPFLTSCDPEHREDNETDEPPATRHATGQEDGDLPELAPNIKRIRISITGRKKRGKNLVYPLMGNLLKFLRTTSTYIRAPGLWTPTPLRENDSEIMDNISQTDGASLLKDVNVVRMYLRVTMISEITTSSGKLIALAALTGKHTYEQQHANLEWPHQPCRLKRAWSRWRKVMNEIAPKRKLMVPLGRWILEVEKRWSFFQSPGNHDRLLQRTQTGWKVYTKQCGAMWAFYPKGPVFFPPPLNPRPIQVASILGYYMTEGYQQSKPMAQVIPSSPSWREGLNTTIEAHSTEWDLHHHLETNGHDVTL